MVQFCIHNRELTEANLNAIKEECNAFLFDTTEAATHQSVFNQLFFIIEKALNFLNYHFEFKVNGGIYESYLPSQRNL